MKLKYPGIIVAAIAATISIISSCKLRQPYTRPSVKTDSLYRNANITDTASMANLSWKQMFNDPKLQALIAEAIANNNDLKTAIARIKQADANLRQSKAAYLPSVSVGPQFTQQRTSGAQGGSLGIFPNTLYQVSGDASWEIDLWGKLKGANKAALAALLQSYAYQRTVQTQVVANVATNYYNLLAYDKQLAVTRQAVESYKSDVETNKALKQANRVNEASVAQSEANRYAAEVTVPDLQNSISQTENAICLLLGRQPGAIPRDSLYAQPPDSLLQTGLPAQILSNRPDVQEAEYKVRYYFEQINVARAYFYPKLSITAQGGWQSATIGTLFNHASIFGNVIGNLTQPVFNQGLNKQRLRVAQAEYEEYVNTFQQTVLTGGQEVSNALQSYHLAKNKAGTRNLQLDAWKRAVDYNRQLLKGGYVTYTDVLTSEQGYLSTQLSSVGDRLQQLTAIVTLYQSLGGGWK